MKRKRKLFPFLGVLATALFLISIFFWWWWAIQSVIESKQTQPQIFVIKKGEDLTSIAFRLKEKNLIRNSLAFKVFVLIKGLSTQIQAGDFRLDSSMNTEEIAQTLTHGTLDIWLTFPEGWRQEEFAQRLKANLEDFDSQEFLKLAKKSEGYLFPDTYLIPYNASPAAVFKIFSQNFENKFHRDLEKATQKAGLTKEQVVILASIVEKEARQDKDRPLIAGILLKRWLNNWPLQADASIQYAVGNANCQGPIDNCDYWQPVKKADLKIDSPYNTYQYKGLPPGPICNPGLASIRAVIYPQGSDYWFYLSDSLGQIHYAETNQEHSRNIEKYLR